MKKKANRKHDPIGKVKIVKDFLPEPDRLALREAKGKKTTSLNRSQVKFFKKGD